MIARRALTLIASLVAFTGARAQDLVPDHALEVELSANDPSLEGHGPSHSFEYDVTVEGKLHVWASSTDFDPILRIADSDGALLAEDDDSGGGTTAYIALDVKRAGLVRIFVAAAEQGAMGQVLLHACETPRGDRLDLSVQRKGIDDANAARGMGDYDTARARAAEVVADLVARSPDEQSAAWMKLLEAAGHAAFDAGDLVAAKAAWNSAFEFRSRTLPDEHPDLQAARQNLSAALFTGGDIAGARALIEKALEVQSRILPDDHPQLQLARLGVAILLSAQGDFAGARALQEQVLGVYSRTLPADHVDLARAQTALARTRARLGDFEGARLLLEQALEVLSRTLREDSAELTIARSSLAAIIYEQGDLTGALVLQQRQVEVISRTLPADHPEQARVRGNLGGTLFMLGDVAGARALYEQQVEQCSRTLPADHPALAKARKHLAVVLDEGGDHEGARAMLEQVLEIQSRTLPADHPDLVGTRGDLAAALISLGDLAGARVLLEAVIEVLSERLPNDNPTLAAARMNLAVTLYQCGDLVGAEVLLEQVCDVRSRTLPADHPELAAARRTLAATLAAESIRASGGNASSRNAEDDERRRERGASLVLEVCRAQTRAARQTIVTSASRGAEERCADLGQDIAHSLCLARIYGAFARTPEVEAACFALSETTRSAALASAAIARRAAGHERYAELRTKLVNASDELAELVSQPAPTREDFDRARTKRETAERELSTLARELTGGTLAVVEVDVASLSTSLGEQAAAVGFRRMKHFHIEVHEEAASTGAAVVRDVWTEHMFAFVVRGTEAGGRSSADPAGALTIVDLGPIEPIERAVTEWRSSLGAGSGRGISVATEAPGRAERTLAGSLRALVFDPLLAAIGDRKRVVLALDDVLHLVPFDMLPVDADGETLLRDRWEIETRATLSELLADTAASPRSGGFLGVGGVRYDGSGADASVAVADGEPDTTPRPPHVAALLRGGPDSHRFGALPATQEEVEGLGRFFGAAFGPEAGLALLEGEEASKARLLERAPAARFVHIATHGWFAPDSIKSWSDREASDKQSGLGLRMSSAEEIKGMSPMLLCGLALAGANLPENAVGRAPGLVTADELSTLDLSNCELAVLSACDTNVGERRAGQGVASLQKALQMAGARSVITSLWKVPDEATKELMLDFYRRLWVQKKPKHQALWEAKTRLREAKDESGRPKYTTRDWAAWVLTGDSD